jgi:hypothetical protein
MNNAEGSQMSASDVEAFAGKVRVERADDLMRAGLSPADAAHYAERTAQEIHTAVRLGLKDTVQRAASIADAAKVVHNRVAEWSRPPVWLLEALICLGVDAGNACVAAHKAAPSAPASAIKPLSWQPNPAGRMSAWAPGGFYMVTLQKVGRDRLFFFPADDRGSKLIGEIDGDDDMRRIGQAHHDSTMRKWLEGAAA